MVSKLRATVETTDRKQEVRAVRRGIRTLREGWGDGPVGEALFSQTWGPEFEYLEPT